MFFLYNGCQAWCLFTAVDTITKIETRTRDWGIAMIDLIMLLFGRIWVRKVECFKHHLMGQIKRNLEYLNCRGLAQEVSEEKNLVCCLEIVHVIFWLRKWFRVAIVGRVLEVKESNLD